MPDYANAIQVFSNNISSSSTYTAPFDGILIINWHTTSSSNVTCQAKINGIFVGESSSQGWSTQSVIMKKNDVITLNLENAIVGNTTMFVPYA